MKPVLLIGHNDLRVFLKRKASFIWLFIMPLVFVGFMGFAMRGSNDPANARPPVRLENRDTNFLASVFTAELGTQGMRVLEPGSEEPAPQIRVPADFTERILAGKPVKVGFKNSEKELSAEGAMVELRLLRAIIAMNSHLLVATGNGEPALSAASVRQAQAAAPLVRLEARFAGRKPMPTGFKFSLPGNMVMYILMNLLVFGGVSVARNRQDGLLRRLACQPLSRAALVAGKTYGLLLLGLLQALVFLLAGRFLFHVNFAGNLGPVLLLLLVYSWVAASMGLLVGSVVQAEDKVVGVCVLVSLLMGALGGCWWPVEIGPPALRTVAHCLPTGWALQALHQLLSFGGGLGDILRPLGLLGLFGLAINTLAARAFRW